MELQIGANVRHSNGWVGKIIDRNPFDEMLLKVRRFNTNSNIEVPVSELELSFPSANNFANTRNNSIGGRRLRRRRNTRHCKKSIKRSLASARSSSKK